MLDSHLPFHDRWYWDEVVAQMKGPREDSPEVALLRKQARDLEHAHELERLFSARIERLERRLESAD